MEWIQCVRKTSCTLPVVIPTGESVCLCVLPHTVRIGMDPVEFVSFLSLPSLADNTRYKSCLYVQITILFSQPGAYAKEMRQLINRSTLSQGWDVNSPFASQLRVTRALNILNM